MAHSSKNISLSEYLKDVHNGNILIPQFQRDFVWSKSQMLKLAASLLKGYPIGSFLLMQDTGEYATKLIDGVDTKCNNKNQDALLVLDGQQRTTTGYQIFYGKGDHKFYFNYSQFIHDIKDAEAENIKSIIEDRIEEWLIAIEAEKAIINPDEQRTKGYFPLENILNFPVNQDYVQWLDTYTSSNSLDINSQFDIDKFNRLCKYKSYFVRELVESITSYQASEIIIDKNTSPNIVCTIFETINLTGQKLTVFDLLNAKCFPLGFILRTELEKSFEEKDIFNEFDNDKDSLIGISIIKVIGLICKKSCKKSDLLDLKAEEIKYYWNEAVELLEIALEFMKNNYGILGLKYFPYKDMLPVIAIIVKSLKFTNNTEAYKIKLNKWYWYAVFSGYFDNATETKSAKAIKELLGSEKEKGWFDDDSLVPEVIKSNQLINFENLDNLSSTQSAQYKAILNLIALNNAQDFSSERKLIRDMKEKDLQDHHIIPKKFLSLHLIRGNKANTILNRTLISVDANNKIKDKSPFEYIHDKVIVNEDLTSQELLKHCINKSDLDSSSFTEQIYTKFKENRKKLIIQLIKAQL